MREPLLVAQTGRGRPLQRRGGAGHGDCELGGQTNELLTSIVPRFSGEGLTVDPHPTFWVYVPYALSDSQSMQFLLKDQSGKTIYQPNLMGARELPGIMNLRLPADVTLAEDQQYTWTFTVICGEMKLTVEGAVTRLARSPELEDALRAATTPQAQADVYRNFGLWLDALTVLAEQRQTKPNDAAIASAWNELLNAIQLDDVADKPIVGG
ncbi:DUF928 domain-containing protein [Leptolyngbya sp. 7M]|uniref:DUF928 domain-containing protein n=1 Tax=Leptolyngbya sp. 7M TaxID=2812896 RepID=UPI001B8D1C7D|nr:DUF928 domain-containing protein [Leptolyngbya sp. 7M]QYO63312.1 DUF928 domain-containing protein [Leptolyngbya sp. 7M]